MSKRKDSWQYPLAHLDAAKPTVKALAVFLKKWSPRFTKPDAEALCLDLRRNEVLSLRSVQIVDGTGLSQDMLPVLVRHLMDVQAAYGPDRERRARFLRELAELRSRIPEDERTRLRAITEADRAHVPVDFADDRELAKMRTFKSCRFWLSMSTADRHAWLTRVEQAIAEGRRQWEAGAAEREAEIRDFFRARFGENWQARLREPFGFDSGVGGAHAVLGLQQTATADEVRAAYRRLVKQHHPDMGGDVSQFKAVQQAYERISGGMAS